MSAISSSSKNKIQAGRQAPLARFAIVRGAVLFALASHGGLAPAANLVPNGDFRAGALNWSADGATRTRIVSDDTSPQSPTLEIASDTSVEARVRSRCVSIETRDDLLLSGELRSQGLQPSIVLEGFMQSDCTGPVAFVNRISSADSGWEQRKVGPFQLPETVRSVRVVLLANPSVDREAVARFRNIQFGPAGTSWISLDSNDYD